MSLVNPEIPIPRFVASLTGISNEMVRSAPVFADVAPQWLDFVSDSVLVAHNAPFDTSFLNHEISRVYPGHRMVNPHLCTVRLSRRALPDLSNHRLDTIANHFSIPIVSRHRAGSDALATAEIFLLLLTELEETHGIKDLAGARNFQFAKRGMRVKDCSRRVAKFAQRRKVANLEAFSLRLASTLRLCVKLCFSFLAPIFAQAFSISPNQRFTTTNNTINTTSPSPMNG